MRCESNNALRIKHITRKGGRHRATIDRAGTDAAGPRARRRRRRRCWRRWGTGLFQGATTPTAGRTRTRAGCTTARTTRAWRTGCGRCRRPPSAQLPTPPPPSPSPSPTPPPPSRSARPPRRAAPSRPRRRGPALAAESTAGTRATRRRPGPQPTPGRAGRALPGWQGRPCTVPDRTTCFRTRPAVSPPSPPPVGNARLGAPPPPGQSVSPRPGQWGACRGGHPGPGAGPCASEPGNNDAAAGRPRVPRGAARAQASAGASRVRPAHRRAPARPGYALLAGERRPGGRAAAAGQRRPGRRLGWLPKGLSESPPTE